MHLKTAKQIQHNSFLSRRLFEQAENLGESGLEFVMADKLKTARKYMVTAGDLYMQSGDNEISLIAASAKYENAEQAYLFSNKLRKTSKALRRQLEVNKELLANALSNETDAEILGLLSKHDIIRDKLKLYTPLKIAIRKYGIIKKSIKSHSPLKLAARKSD